ncbi:uncharacterized protein BO88DRAFT_430478 [Aspergillus vadensis CBS 113365]|uniref:Uncharacterized protein n=1 Tax=Aspergillus vadensis (strain CBS 113365 / IMI 142717 / IBT 24658) TaxID=1448311 RepID=A0A319BAC7_ASPVC|nr:hypothetical protein BO88DRAFT_430478 [Aspergillus vadensis CBS 113365]PYH63453.1 hypothetical protein BO88DRAFT_430478 [Aspergillus vadensis CBS 113365]
MRGGYAKAARRGRIIQHTGPTAIVRAANRQRQRRMVKDFSPALWSVPGQLVLAFSTAARFVPRLDGSSSLCLAVCKKTNPVDYHATPLDLLKRQLDRPEDPLPGGRNSEGMTRQMEGGASVLERARPALNYIQTTLEPECRWTDEFPAAYTVADEISSQDYSGSSTILTRRERNRQSFLIGAGSLMASGAIPVQDQSPDRRFSSLLIASSQSLSGPVRYLRMTPPDEWRLGHIPVAIKLKLHVEFVCLGNDWPESSSTPSASKQAVEIVGRPFMQNAIGTIPGRSPVISDHNGTVIIPVASRGKQRADDPVGLEGHERGR